MIPLQIRNILSQIGSSPVTPNQGVVDPNSFPQQTQQPIAQPMTMDTNDPSNEQDMIARLSALFKPSYAAQGQLSDYINKMPLRGDYKPSTMQKIGGMLANLGTATPGAYHDGTAIGFNANIPEGLQAQEYMLNRPYNRAVEDWKQKLQPLENLAGRESARNINERTIANDILSQSVRAGQLKRQTKRDEEIRVRDEAKQATSDERTAIAKQRADAYVFKSTHNDMKGYIDKDGKLVFVNPKNPSIVVHTGVDTGKLNDIDKINYGIQGKLDEIAATGEEARKTEATKQPNRLELKTTVPGKNVTPTTKAPPVPSKKVVRDAKGNIVQSLETTYGDQPPDVVMMEHPTTHQVGPVAGKDVAEATKHGYKIVIGKK